MGATNAAKQPTGHAGGRVRPRYRWSHSMTYLTSSTTLAPSTGPSFFAGIVAGLRNHFQIRRSVNELRALSPEMLRDIGIDRSEIERVARFGR
jgi:uncharacterized protein YjiS (DUF1127 family)